VAIRLEGKKAIVAEVNEAASGALSLVLADYRGITSGDMTEKGPRRKSATARCP